MPTPTRSTPEQQLDAWNAQMRQSPAYLDFMRRNGLPTDGRVKLSRDQQSAFERHLRANGIQIPSGMHIDQGGNLNQKNRLMRNIGIGAAAGGAALTGFGLAGLGPLAGMGGGAAAGGAGAAGGTLASSSLPVASLMGGPAAITSGAASAGIPLGGMAAGAGAAAAGRGVGGALQGAGKNLLSNLTSVDGIASLAPLIASLAAGGMGGGNSGGSDNEFLQRAYEDSKRQNQMQEARYRRVDPLHEAVTQLAFNRLPVSSRQGITQSRVPLPE